MWEWYRKMKYVFQRLRDAFRNTQWIPYPPFSIKPDRLVIQGRLLDSATHLAWKLPIWSSMKKYEKMFRKWIWIDMILLMERNCAPVEVGSFSHYSQGFIHPRWLFGISSINSILLHFFDTTKKKADPSKVIKFWYIEPASLLHHNAGRSEEVVRWDPVESTSRRLDGGGYSIIGWKMMDMMESLGFKIWHCLPEREQHFRLAGCPHSSSQNKPLFHMIWSDFGWFFISNGFIVESPLPSN